jgi:hypothetical protein
MAAIIAPASAAVTASAAAAWLRTVMQHRSTSWMC